MELVALNARLTHLLAQLLDESAVLLHGVGDELDVLDDLAALVAALAVLDEVDAFLRLIDFLETLLDLVESLHHVVNLAVLLADDSLERIVLLNIFNRSLLLVVAA